MSSFSMPLVLQGEAINCYASNDDEFHTLQPDKDTFRDFSTGASYPVQSNPILGRFIEGIPLSDITTVDNPDNFSASNPFDYPLECPKNIVPSDYSNTMNYECNNLALDTSTMRWDFSKSPISNGWILPDCGRSSNELSLSLSTSRPNGSLVQERCLETSSSSLTNYSLHQRHIGSEQTSCNSNNISSSFGSSKLVEISHLLLGSRYFHGVQEILAEIARFAIENLDQTSYSTTGIEDSLAISFPSGRGDCGLQDREVETKKKHLLALLQMVDDRFNQCLDEIHTVVSAFHAVTELDPNMHARFALPTISFMYKNLRERISCHILALGANFNEGREKEDKSFEASFIQKQWALQQLRRRDHPLWRPQRGLPERSVSVLRAWMFQNFLHPYPKDAEKHLLALKSGLTRSQVSNWFINARVRLWKPMIEEMYAEMNRRNGYRNDEGNDRSHMFFENTRFNLQ